MSNNAEETVVQTPEEIAAAAQEAEAAAAAAAAEADKEEDEDDLVYTESIDLGNGKTLDFEADSPEELKEKIFEALRKGHKTEDKTEAAAAAEPAPAKRTKKTLSTDEEFALNEEFKVKPTKAIEEYFQKTYGMSLDEIVDSAESGGKVARGAEAARREMSAVDAFKKKHPEYVPTQANLVAFNRYLNTFKMEGTVENLETAYKELTEQGLVVNKAPAAAAAAAAPEKEEEDVTPPAQIKKKAASSLSFGKQGAPASRTTAVKKPKSQAELAKIAEEKGSDALYAQLEEDWKAGAAG
ncbi:MAG TPA: hypothetical protein VHA06_17905 [Candidatus Angelobacter sp.]|jgi:hypothetical protein|nr:hypothetical protein [Candidatus Angelobacter sp.]